MKKLYLHMGFHKTATTSFQDTCKKNIAKLFAQSFIYPCFKDYHVNKDYHVGLALYSIYHKNPETSWFHIFINKSKDIKSLHAEYSKSLEQVLSQRAKNIILSQEDISLFDVDTLKNMKTFLEQYEYEIIPIAIIRSPYENTCSFIQQAVKAEYTDFSFIGRAEAVKNIKEAFPNIQFFAFKESCKHSHGPVGFLLEQIGVDYKNFEIMHTNESLPNIQVRIQNLLNVNNARSVNDAFNPDSIAVHSWYVNSDLSQKFLLTQEEYACIKDECDAENIWFKENLGEEFTDKEIKFVEEDERVKTFEKVVSSIESQNFSVEEKKRRYRYYLNKHFFSDFAKK